MIPGTERIEIQPIAPPRARIRVPGSKSLTNRALVIAALAKGRSELEGALESDDTRVMMDSLRRLGISVDWDPAAARLRVIGCGGVIPAERAELFIGNSGTTMRFLTAMVCLGRGQYRLDGVARMRHRPIADLIDALRALGAEVSSEAGTGCPPVVARGGGLQGGRVAIGGSVSSQFVSALLMVAPYAAADLTIEVPGGLVSRPYVAMTAAVMGDFGGRVDGGDPRRLTVRAGQTYRGRAYVIEPDASAASYFYAAAAITRGVVTVEGLGPRSVQGDVRFVDLLERMGCRIERADDAITVQGAALRGIDADMADISDTVQTLAAVAVFAAGPTRIRNVGHIRHKETDRVADLARELRRLGAAADEWPDGLTIHPGPLHAAEVHTYDDHRMAMSLALVGLRVPGVVILDPGCTAKTYPDYFADLERLSQGS